MQAETQANIDAVRASIELLPRMLILTQHKPALISLKP